ncbi:MAG: DMT family transporter [Rhodobacter sp.]|nr:DMT family transporter [Rhodobacter sp.]
MPDPSKSNLWGVLCALAAFALFSSHDVIVKSLGGTYAPFQIVFFSVLFGFPLATLMLMRDPTSGHLRPVHPWWTALRTGATVVTASSGFYAFSTLPLTQVYAILFAAPLLITVLSIPVLGERVGLHRWAAVAVGLAGVLVVLRPGVVPLGLGHAAAIVAAVGAAVASVIVRKIGRDERSVVMLLYPMVANFVAMGAVLPFVYRPLPAADLGALAVMSALAFAAMLLLIAAYRRADAAIVAPMQYSQILWATVFGAVVFGETPDRHTALGAAIVILSGVYIVIREGRANVSANQPVLRTRSRAATPSTPRIAGLMARTERAQSDLENGGKDG